MDILIIFGAKYLWIAPVLGALYVFWKSDSKKRIFGLAALALPVTYVCGVIARILYFNPRPFVVNNFTPLVEHVADNGFPSDHVLLVGAIAGVIGKYDTRWGALLWLIAIAVGASRVLAGVHHTVDILASLAISALVTRVIYLLGKRDGE